MGSVPAAPMPLDHSQTGSPGHLTWPDLGSQQLCRAEAEAGPNLRLLSEEGRCAGPEEPGRLGEPMWAGTGTEESSGLKLQGCHSHGTQDERCPWRPTFGECRWELGADRPNSQGPPCPPHQGPSSPEGSSGRRLFLATSARAPKPRPTARPARRRLRALGIRSGAAHCPPPTRPGAAPHRHLPRSPGECPLPLGTFADTPDILKREGIKR